MFKDYYLILGISKEATAEDIEKAYKNVLSKMDDKTSPAYYQEVKEAFTVLSNKETKIMYDKELSAFNWSDGFGNHVIKDTKLASIINTLQGINKEKVADKRKSDEEGSPLQEESISYESTTDEQTPVANEPRKMSLFRRFVGSIIDKVILISVFVIGYVIISPYEAPSKLGSYIGLLKTSPDAYEYIDKVKIYKYNSGEYNKRVSTAYQDMVRAYSEPPHIGSTKENDLNISFSIIILNLLYFFLSELFLSASLGKRMLGGVLHDSAGDKIGFGKAFSRCLWFATLMAGIYYLFHLQIASSNFAVLVIFFLLLDLPVLFTKRSLLDMVTGTKLVYRSHLYGQQLKNNQEYNKKRTKEGKKRKPFLTNKMNKIVWFVYFLLSVFVIHNILFYFFGNYYNISNYNTTFYNEKESDNYIRKKYENETRSWNVFPKEQFAISRQLSHSNSIGYWANPKYGPVPEGVPVSTYECKGTDSYIAGYNDVKRFFWKDVPPRTIEEVYNPKKKKVYYTTPEPYYRTYSYRNSISTYAISAFMSFLPNYESLNVNYLNDIAKQLNAVGISWNYINIDDKTAIAYCNKEHNVRRIIVCANGNAYLLETEATGHLREQSDLFLSSVSINHYHIVGGKWKIITMFCMLILCVILAIVIFVNKQHSNVIQNRYAYSLFCLGISSIVVCFFIAIYQSYMLYTDYYASCSSVLGLIGALISVPFIFTPLCLFYYRKTRERWKYDYIVPFFLKNVHLDFMKSDFLKKMYISYICYPTMILSLLPFGFIIVLLIFVPILLVITFIIWFNKWHRWVKESKMPEDFSMNN